MIIPIKLLSPDAAIPHRAHSDDAGADLAACIPDVKHVDIAPNETRKVPTSVALAIPTGYAGIITSRSSMRLKGIAVAGVVDSQYRGAVHMIVTNTTGETIRIEHGQRVAQLLIQKVELATFVVSHALGETQRQDGGFGSTDRQPSFAERLEVATRRSLESIGVEVPEAGATGIRVGGNSG